MKMLNLTVTTLLIVAALGRPVLADTGSVPPLQEGTVVNRSSAPLPGNRVRLTRELALHSSVRYRILVVDDSGGVDKTDYLDEVAAQMGGPAPDTLLLVVYANDNYDLRFYMGANFRQMGATVESMLAVLRSQYFPLSQRGDVAGGLARLVARVNGDFSESMQFPIVDSRVPVDVRKEITGWANRYLLSFFSADQPDRLRALSVGLDEISLVDSKDGPAYKVVYSVMPVSPSNSDWLAGSGVLAPDGWIHGKVKLMRAVTEDGELKLIDGMP